jgi:hypothetical protein
MIKSVMLRFDKFLHATDKAYLLRVGDSEHWLPKRLCRNLITNKKLGGNVSVPTFIYERVTGIKAKDIPMSDADYIIEKHVPAKIEAKETQPNVELLKDQSNG